METNLLSIVALNVLLWLGGCKQEVVPPIQPPIKTDTTKTDTVFSVKLLFKVVVPNTIGGDLASRSIYTYNGTVIQWFGSAITCFNGITGEVVWQNTSLKGDADAAFLLSGDKLAMCYDWQTVAVVSAESGATLWKTTIPQSVGTGCPRISVSDNYVYHSVRSPDNKKCYLRRSPLAYAAWDTVATWGMETYTNKWGITADYPPDLEPPTEYVVPGTTDTLLYFYNRTGLIPPGGGYWCYMALHCINANAGNIVWSRPMIDPSGTAGNSVVMYRDKIYVTLHSLTCLNPFTGTTIWEYNIGNEGVPEGFTGNGAFSDGKIAFAPGNNRLHCISAETGQRLWINPDAGQSFVIHACNGRIGYNWRVFDLNTGKLLVPKDYIQGSSLTMDCATNRVYTQGQDNGKNYLFGYQMLK